MIVYHITGSDQELTLADAVLRLMAAHRQLGRSKPESGGQLFGRVHNQHVEVLDATGPRRRDARTRFSFRPDRAAERREIQRMHRQGLSYLGDWHTHPEQLPQPSLMDLRSIAETACQSRYTLGPLILIVVGLAPPPAGLYVCLHSGLSLHRLEPSAVVASAAGVMNGKS